MAENREYKSDVFSMLMEDKANALQVYNVLNGSSYDDPEMVEMVNLDKIISLSIRNDAAFIVGTDISIYEHQSSSNPNMPLRSLIYYSTILKGLVENRYMHGSQLVRIPTPHFAVFYNGKIKRPETEIMRLSEAFEQQSDEPELELICKVYNINPGREILQRCNVLSEYTQFVEIVRKYEAEACETPIETAIEYCIDHHILESFLRARGMEVINAMTIDMTIERQMELMREEANQRVEEEKKRAEEANQRVEEEKKRAEEANQRVEEEKKRVEEEKKRAEEEKKRADKAEKELAELKRKFGITDDNS